MGDAPYQETDKQEPTHHRESSPTALFEKLEDTLCTANNNGNTTN